MMIKNKKDNNYIYYDLDRMRSFIFREWDKPEDKNWIKDLAYVGGKKSDYALLLPIAVSDRRFKPYIKQCNTNILEGEYGKGAKEKEGVYYTNRTNTMIKLSRKGKIKGE